MASADTGTPLYTALTGSAPVASLLPAYLGGVTVFTTRPVPQDAAYPMVVVSSDVSVIDRDGIKDLRPVITRDIACYGLNDTTDHYHAVDTLAFAVRDLFHRNPKAISMSGWSVLDIVCNGPRPAPTDDERTIGRVVTLNIQLAALR